MHDDGPITSAPDPADLVTLQVADSEFEANTIVATLHEAGIEAVAFGATSAAWPALGAVRVPIQVRREDLERAKAAIKKTIADSVDLDWDEVDVGQREDEVPLNEPGRLPMIPRAGQIAAIIVVALMLLLAVWFLSAMPWW